MRFTAAECRAETFAGKGPGGTVVQADFRGITEELIRRYEGTVQTVYLDPPYNTGKQFVLRQRCGEAGWQVGRPFLTLPAYSDAWQSEEELLSLIRAAAELARTLLRDDGSLFVHIDSRMHARVRLMLDEVFGAKAFANEIIWAYQSGGRSEAYFSRKHDVILYYRKTPKAYFNIGATGVPRAGARTNHMKRAVDASGRAYRSIVSQGKEYRYYDDEMVYPGDVWDDVSHLQQKDPQRTGYDTQKPARLLERIIGCSTRPGDLVCDLFAGSGTAAAVAAGLGRSFLMVDASDAAVAVMRKRLLGYAFRLEAPSGKGSPRLAGGMRKGLGFLEVWLDGYLLEDGLCPLALCGNDALEQLSVGFLREGVFHAFANAARAKQTPALPAELETPMLEGALAVSTVDVLARRLIFTLEEDA